MECGEKKRGKSFVFKSRANTSSKSISWAKLPCTCSTAALLTATGTFIGTDRENRGFLANSVVRVAEPFLFVKIKCPKRLSTRFG